LAKNRYRNTSGTAKAKAAAKLPKTALAEQLEKIQNFIETRNAL
jgi:hypothetical protein